MARRIESTGPVPCPYMLIAERPGIEEAHRGRVLCGPSGQELDRYLLYNAGIHRERVYCTNLVKDYRDGENPERWEVERDRPELMNEIARVRPQYIGLMGLWSARTFLGPALDMEWAHGLAFPLVYAARFCMPLYHTAAGLHQPATAAKIAYDFTQFGCLCKEQPVRMYREDMGRVSYSEDMLTLADTVAMDTEGSVERPWCVSYSVRARVASVQRRGHPHRKWNCENMHKAKVVLHNAIADLPVLERMGIRPRRFTDTMQIAALLGVEPLSLKSLARRHCGMAMQEYSDIVAPAQQELALAYLEQVLELAETIPPTESK